MRIMLARRRPRKQKLRDDGGNVDRPNHVSRLEVADMPRSIRLQPGHVIPPVLVPVHREYVTGAHISMPDEAIGGGHKRDRLWKLSGDLRLPANDTRALACGVREITPRNRRAQPPGDL